MRLLLFTLFFLFSLTSFAQEERYFSRNFQTHEKKQTPNKRVYYLEDTGIRIEDYGNGKLERKGFIKGTRSFDQADAYIWYTKTWHTGLETNKREYFPQLSGTFSTYNAKGNLEEELYARGFTVRIGQLWSRDNTPLLENGTGSNHTFSNNNTEKVYYLYKDSIMVAGYSVRLKQKDTIYVYADKMAMPKEGMAHFTTHLATTVQYPGLAGILGKEGVVYISFIVNEEGKLVEFIPLNRPGSNFHKKAIEKMADYPAWAPAVVNGRPVKMRYSIPFRFQMER
ncbi:energy transducer TonB [Rufibacter roseus]|uniref:Energy transducer TonB n=1 Tax=Rufibacter roseus TaxID=1567108 RepID=A0ABW2DHQ0_9BACT|nr:energy transducer TonB [Rufibacter roseus]